MSSSEPLAARPFPLGRGLVLRNRLVGTAHASGLVADGLALPGDAEYWRRRAAGGAAMLVVGGTVTAPESTWRRRVVTEAWREEAVPGMAARAGAIRGEGAVAACQLVHLGRETAPGAVIGVRLSTDGGEEAGLTLDGLCELLPHVSALADYINLTVGVRTTYVRDMATAEPPLLPHLARIRPLTSRPVLVSQAFRRTDQIDAALGAGADLVGMARPLIADPDLPAKLLSGRGAQVRPCVSCNEDCRTFDPVLLCSVNPELAPDGAARRPAAPLLAKQAGGGRGDRVAIVGAGPAGLECAVALADGGTLAGAAEVVVFDQRDVIGGQLAVAAAAPNRAGWQALLVFYQASLDATDGVTLRLSTTAGPADLADFGEVVLAVGSGEVLPEVAGIERAVASSLAIASGPSALAGREHLLIVDDGFGSWSCASAVELGVRAAVPKITVATPGAAFGASLPAEGRVQLIARLRGAPLDVLPFTALSFVGDGCAELRNMMSRAIRRIAADAVIVVGERRARDWRSLVPSGPTVRVIGDALVPRRVAHAISEGRAAADAIRASRPHTPATAVPA
jgi:2,4-dienoyl-CoA reductase (NADPH2)